MHRTDVDCIRARIRQWDPHCINRNPNAQSRFLKRAMCFIRALWALLGSTWIKRYIYLNCKFLLIAIAFYDSELSGNPFTRTYFAYFNWTELIWLSAVCYNLSTEKIFTKFPFFGDIFHPGTFYMQSGTHTPNAREIKKRLFKKLRQPFFEIENVDGGVNFIHSYITCYTFRTYFVGECEKEIEKTAMWMLATTFNCKHDWTEKKHELVREWRKLNRGKNEKKAIASSLVA